MKSSYVDRFQTVDCTIAFIFVRRRYELVWESNCNLLRCTHVEGLGGSVVKCIIRAERFIPRQTETLAIGGSVRFGREFTITCLIGELFAFSLIKNVERDFSFRTDSDDFLFVTICVIFRRQSKEKRIMKALIHVKS